MSEVLVAKLGKTVGLKGFVKFHSQSDFEELFKPGLILRDKSGRSYEIKDFDAKNMQARFLGFESIELAKALVNTQLYQSEEESRKLCKLEKDEYFYFDVIGCEVYEEGDSLGRIIDILEQGPSFLLKIKGEKEFFIPYVDKYILEVDITNKRLKTKEAKAILENS